jgi:hypothetical protein
MNWTVVPINGINVLMFLIYLRSCISELWQLIIFVYKMYKQLFSLAFTVYDVYIILFDVLFITVDGATDNQVQWINLNLKLNIFVDN